MKKTIRILFAALTVTLFCPFAFVQQSTVAAPRKPDPLHVAPAQPADASANPSTGSNVTTLGGTVNALPLWTSSTNVQSSAVSQTGSGGTVRVTVKGTLVIPATGGASAAGGKPSEPINLTTSAFNSDTGTAVGQTFQLRTVPVNNNTSTPSASLDFRFAHGSAPPAETGLKINDQGIISFAPDQRVPGAPVAMVAITDSTGNAAIVRCYNATLQGAAATTPPCGLSVLDALGDGTVWVGFNFDVGNNFSSATNNGNSKATGIQTHTGEAGPNVITVVPLVPTASSVGSTRGDFTLIVY